MQIIEQEHLHAPILPDAWRRWLEPVEARLYHREISGTLRWAVRREGLQAGRVQGSCPRETRSAAGNRLRHGRYYVMLPADLSLTQAHNNVDQSEGSLEATQRAVGMARSRTWSSETSTKLSIGFSASPAEVPFRVHQNVRSKNKHQGANKPLTSMGPGFEATRFQTAKSTFGICDFVSGRKERLYRPGAPASVPVRRASPDERE